MSRHAALRLVVGLAVAVPVVAAAQGAPPRAVPRDAATETELLQAFTAIEAANGYPDIVDAVQEHEAVIASVRMVDLADERLRSGGLDANQRGVVLLLRQLSVECRAQGPRPIPHGLRDIVPGCSRPGHAGAWPPRSGSLSRSCTSCSSGW